MIFKLEICVDNVEPATDAQNAGADRVELCNNLMEGGTTPGSGMIVSARNNLTIGLNVLIRPRGGDFLYSDPEYNDLQTTFLVHQVDRFSIKGKEVLAGTHKYYINDLAFKNYLYTGFEYGYGYMLENIIYLQLINTGYNVYTGYMRNKEIDFIATKNNKTLYIQVAYLLVDKATIEREYAELEAIPDNYEKFVVSLDDVQLPDKNGIKHVLAWKLDEVL